MNFHRTVLRTSAYTRDTSAPSLVGATKLWFVKAIYTFPAVILSAALTLSTCCLMFVSVYLRYCLPCLCRLYCCLSSSRSPWYCLSSSCSLCNCQSSSCSLWCCLSTSCSLCYCLSSSCGLCYCLSSS